MQTLFYGVRKASCAIARIYICAHVKDAVVHVRVRWIMETLKHPACTVGWVGRLCRSWRSPGKATRISYGRNPIGTIQLSRKKVIETAHTTFVYDSLPLSLSLSLSLTHTHTLSLSLSLSPPLFLSRGRERSLAWYRSCKRNPAIPMKRDPLHSSVDGATQEKEQVPKGNFPDGL